MTHNSQAIKWHIKCNPWKVTGPEVTMTSQNVSSYGGGGSYLTTIIDRIVRTAFYDLGTMFVTTTITSLYPSLST